MATEASGAETPSVRHFLHQGTRYSQNRIFTKTGSGQTKEKLTDRRVSSCRYLNQTFGMVYANPLNGSVSSAVSKNGPFLSFPYACPEPVLVK